MMSPSKAPVELTDLALALLKIPERWGRTGANRAEDWSARPPREPETHQCWGRCCDAGGERKLMGQVEPTGRLDDEESESFEAPTAALTAAGAAARDREDWPLHVSNFLFVALLELVDAYVRQVVGPAVSEREADCRRDLEVLRCHPGRSKHEPASVGLA